MRILLLTLAALIGCTVEPGPRTRAAALVGAVRRGPAKGEASPGSSERRLPAGFGVEIHFVEPQERDLQMIAEAGFRFVRMDFTWKEIERQRGSYDFGAYERLVNALAQRGIRPVFILDYGNPLYDNELAPQTEEARQAFARFAAAGAAKFRGRGIVWELWNEPNVVFWKPCPNVDDYVALARAVLPAMRQADPQAILIAPAAAVFDLQFLERCFERGLLELVDAVSVHPYGRIPPETVARDHHRLRVLIDQYAPEGKKGMPIVSGEWGFSGTWFSRERQAQLLARQYLANLASDVTLSIYYDWHDDGTDPKEPENNYGTVTHDYQLKSAYHAARTLNRALEGWQFRKRVTLRSADDYALLFTKDGTQKLALWTTGEPHAVTLPWEMSSATVVAMTGEQRRVEAAGGRLVLDLTGSPQYLTPAQRSSALELEEAWQVESKPGFSAGVTAQDANAPRLTVVVRNAELRMLRGSVEAAIPAGFSGAWAPDNQFALGPRQSARLTWSGTFPTREPRTFQVPVTLRVDGRPDAMRAEVSWSVRNPVRIRPSLRSDAHLLDIENPSGEPFDGVVTLRRRGDLDSVQVAVRLGAGERRKGLDLPVARRGGGVSALSVGSRTGVTLSGTLAPRDAPQAAVSVAPLSIVDVDAFQTPLSRDRFEAVLDGDPQVPAKAQLTVTEPPADAEGARYAGRIEYDFGAGWRLFRVTPKQPLPIPGKPKAVRMRIYNATSTGDAIYCRFADASGKTFQPTVSEKLTWQGWRWITMPLDDPNTPHWGGADDDQIHYPIRWDSLLVVGSPGHAHKGEVAITGLTLLYEGEAP